MTATLPTPTHAQRHHAGGFALIVALVILLAITVVGVATIRSTLIEQRLANATQDRNLAFQAAEAALRVGEAQALLHAQTQPLTPQLSSDGSCDRARQANCTDGLCLLHDPDCPLRAQDPAFTGWANATGLNLGTLAGQSPQYIVEFLGADFLCHDPDPTNPNDPNNYCKRYRITARSLPAGNDRATVILETLFAAE